MFPHIEFKISSLQLFSSSFIHEGSICLLKGSTAFSRVLFSQILYFWPNFTYRLTQWKLCWDVFVHPSFHHLSIIHPSSVYHLPSIIQPSPHLSIYPSLIHPSFIHHPFIIYPCSIHNPSITHPSINPSSIHSLSIHPSCIHHLSLCLSIVECWSPEKDLSWWLRVSEENEENKARPYRMGSLCSWKYAPVSWVLHNSGSLGTRRVGLWGVSTQESLHNEAATPHSWELGRFAYPGDLWIAFDHYNKYQWKPTQKEKRVLLAHSFGCFSLLCCSLSV